MPILPVEEAVYPATLFAEGPQPSAERNWWVLHTRPRQEKCLARQLHQRQLPFYLPVVPRRSQIGGRVFTSQLPLFTGYAFLYGSERERLAALATGRVANVLRVADQERLWQDLRQVHHLIEAGAPITPEGRLAPGVRVEIRCGPLAGLKGKIIRTGSSRRFIVEVDFIQRGASVELDDFALCPVWD
jgi:transcriptional antiterminator RfaH